MRATYSRLNDASYTSSGFQGVYDLPAPALAKTVELSRFDAGGRQYPMEPIPEQLSLGSSRLGRRATKTLRFLFRQIH